jgi:hypothetical protein
MHLGVLGAAVIKKMPVLRVVPAPPFAEGPEPPLTVEQIDRR